MSIFRTFQCSSLIFKFSTSAACPVCRLRLTLNVFTPTSKAVVTPILTGCGVIQKRNIGHLRLPSYYQRNEKINEDEPRTAVEESTEDFKHVLRLIPKLEVPEVPKHEHYPTPSGWSPPKGPAEGTPYVVRRTALHNVPVYLTQKHGGTQILTIVNKIEGDIWAFANELCSHLSEISGKEIPMQVNEYTMKIKYKGYFKDEVTKWILDKGF